MNAVKEVQQAFEEFEKVQNKFKHFGARDTEPGWVFHDLIRNAVNTGKGELPRSTSGWQLYSEKGTGAAVKELTKAAKKARDLTLKHWGNIDVRNIVQGARWRVDF